MTQVGFEPTTRRLRAPCSTAELLGLGRPDGIDGCPCLRSEADWPARLVARLAYHPDTRAKMLGAHSAIRTLAGGSDRGALYVLPLDGSGERMTYHPGED